jgi:hypothetical protein
MITLPYFLERLSQPDSMRHVRIGSALRRVSLFQLRELIPYRSHFPEGYAQWILFKKSSLSPVMNAIALAAALPRRILTPWVNTDK